VLCWLPWEAAVAAGCTLTDVPAGAAGRALRSSNFCSQQ
jgi:hypothetical protein